MDYTLPTLATAASVPLGINAASYLAQLGIAKNKSFPVNAAPYAGLAIPAIAALGSALATRNMNDENKFMTAIGAAGGGAMGMIPWTKGAVNDSMDSFFAKKIKVPGVGRIGRGAIPLMASILGGLGGYGLSKAFKNNKNNDEQEDV